MKKINPGIKFEKIVSEIQSQLDANAAVTHNEIITDRIGQKRQFDVVVRGKFAGQDILGVLECKDLNKKVGTPEVDAFVTKSQDINANFKILVSKKGFTKPAIDKAKHYGIQTLSLLKNDRNEPGILIGTKWYADIYYWSEFKAALQFVEQPDKKVNFNAEHLKINGIRVIDAFYNYLLDEYSIAQEVGWIAKVQAKFSEPQKVFIDEYNSYLCYAIDFAAHREIDRREQDVGWTGTGFYDWQNSKATIAPNTSVQSQPILADFFSWPKRKERELRDGGFIYIKFIVHALQFEKNNDALELDKL